MEKLINWQEFEHLDAAAQQAALAAIAEMVVKETAVCQHTIDMLSYHNQPDALIQLLQTAYAKVSTDKSASEWQQQTITAQLMDALIFQFLESDPANSAAAPPELVAALQALVPLETEELNRYLAFLSGYTQYKWELAHLAEHAPQNMAALMLEFLAFAHKEAGVAYGRSNLVRQLLPTYFVERRTGQLNPRQDIGDLMRQGRPIARPKPNPHPLAPDSDTLARFLAKLLNYDPIRPYPAAALFTLMPTWLRFLQARSLLKPDEANATLADLASLKDDLLTFFANFAGDEGLATAVAHWSDAQRPSNT
ncbi:MAG: hypothetical protein H6657_20090 [Ardenticatenaceae bacterium]|nr:hypothetical protein [Ardenticatenaceae bacterium]